MGVVDGNKEHTLKIEKKVQLPHGNPGASYLRPGFASRGVTRGGGVGVPKGGGALLACRGAALAQGHPRERGRFGVLGGSCCWGPCLCLRQESR